MKSDKFILLFIFVHFFILGQSQKVSEEQLKNELHQIQNEISNTGIVNNTTQKLEKKYQVAKENKYNVAFIIGVELMRTYSTLDNTEKVIEVSSDVEKYINEDSPPQEVSIMYKMRAGAYGNLGFLEDSHKAYQKSKLYLKNIKDDDVRYYYGSLFYSNYSGYFDQSKKQPDSVRLCLLKGLSEAEKISNKDSKIRLKQKYDLIISIQANLSLYYLWIMQPDNPKEAEKFILNSLEIAKNRDVSPLNEMNLYRTAGDFYFDQKDNDKAIHYAQEGLKLEKRISSPSSRENFYEILTEAYLAQNKTEEGKRYSQLLTKLKDSIKIAEKHSVNKITTEIKKEKDLESNKTLKSYLYIFLIIIIVVGSGIWYYWRNKNKIQQQKFQELITKIENQTEAQNLEEEKTVKVPKTIAEETVNQLLSKISKFEKTERFLRNDITIAGLASHLNTNTKYLSEVIKNHKNKNFNNYINSLRINYITKKLYEDPIYREYKISYLAEACGYSTPRVFLNAFKKETNLTPSDFIKELQNKKSS